MHAREYVSPFFSFFCVCYLNNFFLGWFRCGGTVGIYMYYCVTRCSVLYLSSGISTFTPSPYLDDHGDFSMR